MARNETAAHPVLRKPRAAKPLGKNLAPVQQDLRELPKRPIDIEEVIVRIRAAVQPFPKAALFELYDKGFTTVFEQLVACIISIRTLDEVTVPTAEQLFEAARTPEQVARMTPVQIDRLILGNARFTRRSRGPSTKLPWKPKRNTGASCPVMMRC